MRPTTLVSVALLMQTALAPAAFLHGLHELDGLHVFPAPQTIFRGRTDVVVIDAAVIDGKKPIGTLTKSDFELRDNGVVQQVLDFDFEKQPLDVTLTIDMSGSMTPDKRAVVERAIAQVGQALRPEDRASVVTFGLRLGEVRAMQAPPLVVKLASRPGGTSLVDALMLSLVTAPIGDRRQFALFMTDGDDTTSYFDMRTVLETAKYSTGQSSIMIVREKDQLNNGAILTLFRSVASQTGGEVIELKRGDDLSKAFLAAIEAFRTSYVLRYTPTGVSKQGWHDVAVQVKGKKYTVRARRGYWQ